jgi:hypothetical protein
MFAISLYSSTFLFVVVVAAYWASEQSEPDAPAIGLDPMDAG